MIPEQCPQKYKGIELQFDESFIDMVSWFNLSNRIFELRQS